MSCGEYILGTGEIASGSWYVGADEEKEVSFSLILVVHVAIEGLWIEGL